MAFVVENGTGLANANAYITVAFYRAHHTDRGRDVSAQTDEQVQGFIVRGTDYVERRFGSRYKGERTTLVQSLGLPRTGMTFDGVTYPPDAIPALFQMGIAEYALRAAKYADLSPDKPLPFEREGTDGTVISGGGAVIGSTEKVGPLEDTKQYADPTLGRTDWDMPSYPAADALIQPFLSGTSNGKTIRN